MSRPGFFPKTPSITRGPFAMLGVLAVFLGLLLALLLSLTLVVPGAIAAPPSEFGSTGSGAGQFIEATGIAVNQETRDLYLMDRHNNRVDEFSGVGTFVRAWGWGVINGKAEEQTCTATCLPGLEGAGAGEFEIPLGIAVIAVDNSSGLTQGDVYVLDNRNERVERFSSVGHFERSFPVGAGSSVAVGPAGNVLVGKEGVVQVFGPEGKVEPSISLEEAGAVTGLAVGPAGEIYALGNGAVREYPAAGGKPLQTLDGMGHPVAVSLGAEGEVFISDGNFEGFRVLGYDSSGVQVARFAAGLVGSPALGERRAGMAFGVTRGQLYLLTVGEGPEHPKTEQVRVFTPSAPGPVVEAESTNGVEPTAGVVHAKIDPETGEEANQVHYNVEYGLTTAYGSLAPVPDGVFPGSFNEDPVEVPLSKLLPRTTYHYRVVATDECVTAKIKKPCTTDGEDQTFTTLPPALIEGVSSTDVRSTSATLQARINPLGLDTTYHFSYGPTSACGGEECSAPVPDVGVGAGKVAVDVSPQHLQGLSPGTIYHYRVVAVNALGPVESEQRLFTTQTPGEAGLPDGRQWELVSPPDKHGAAILPFTGLGEELFQAARVGNGIVWPANAPTELRPQGDTAAMQVLSTRGAGGWSSFDLETPQVRPTGVNGGEQHKIFSEDLSLSVFDPFGAFIPCANGVGAHQPCLSPEASEQTPFLRTDYLGMNPSNRCVESCFRPLVTGCPAEGKPCPTPVKEHANVPPGTVFGPEGSPGECPHACGPASRAATPDLSHVVLRSEVALTATKISGEEVYEWANGKLALVSQLPCSPAPCQGEPAGRAKLPLDQGQSPSHAISNDGSRVVWLDFSNGTLYMRDTLREESIEIGAQPFEGANAEGSKVFFAGKECEVKVSASGKLECPVIAEEGWRLLGTSEDGSWVYYEKSANLYVRHIGHTKLIAAEVSGLRQRLEQFPAENELATNHHWRVSSRGEWFAFMSSSSLTGYDNRDAVTGVRDEEVFLYSAAAERLLCASCDPTGARPHGVDSGSVLAHWPEGTSIAASIPGWTPYTNDNTLYQSRYLSNQGRLFFNSADALVPKDVNGQQDVYEFEPAGMPAGPQACAPETVSGSVVFDPAAGGCVGLVSSGESAEESTFVDASETGGDVFFLSSAKLSPLNVDGTISLWDAHECTNTSPCLPQAVTMSRLCDTEASCKPSQAPQPTIFGASGSATFFGAGNLTPPPSAVESRAQKLAKALRVCQRNNRRKIKRARCEREARKRFGPAKRARRSSKHGRQAGDR